MTKREVCPLADTKCEAVVKPRSEGLRRKEGAQAGVPVPLKAQAHDEDGVVVATRDGLTGCQDRKWIWRRLGRCDFCADRAGWRRGKFYRAGDQVVVV
jgi:hypothetical protein